MWNNWIGQRIRRANRWLLLIGLFFCAAALALLWLMLFAIVNFFGGPYPVTDANLVQIKDPDQLRRYFVTFDAPVLFPTNFKLTESKSGNVVAEYVLARMGDQLMLMRIRPTRQGDRFTGEIRAADFDERTKILPALERDSPRVKSALLPYVVDAQTRSFQARVISGMVVVVLLTGLGVWLVIRAGRRMKSPQRHPLAQSLQRFGPPHAVADAIQAETAGCRPFRIGCITFLARWLDCRTNMVRVDDLVWIYKLVVRINGVPVYYIKLLDRHGHEASVSMKQQHVDATLTALLTLAPWLLAGYDPQLADYWKTKRSQMVEAVDQRFQDHQKQQPAPAEPEA